MQNEHHRSIWRSKKNPHLIQTIDQRRLPFAYVIHEIRTADDAATAISEMIIRGAPLIGVTAAYGMYLAALRAPHDKWREHLHEAASTLKATRPTAVNLAWAVDRQLEVIAASVSREEAIAWTGATADVIADDDARNCRMIGEHGVGLIEEIAPRKQREPVNILTHCNAGWLACVEYGTATAPIYLAHERGIPVHVWIDETRPRNQGARLTAWELGKRGVPHTVIVDNAGGHLMQHGMVDIVIVGSDRTTATGDVCNKIGTYLKALAAHDSGVPFYAALPASTFDLSIRDGVREIPIEERSPDEVRYVEGDGVRVPVAPESSDIRNYGFDVTPARLVTGLITERGVCKASEEGIRRVLMHGIESV